MTQSVSFDDDSVETLCVFSGADLLTAHYDLTDLDWQEVAERAELDARRGLIITQVAVLEDLIDDFLHYLTDPLDAEAYQAKLDKQSLGPRLDQLERLLRRAGLLETEVADMFAELRRVVIRRNELAHGTIHIRPVQPIAPGSWLAGVPLEWVLKTRRTKTTVRLTMSGLRIDLHDAIGAFSTLLAYAERFVNQAPRPVNFAGGSFLAAPTP